MAEVVRTEFRFFTPEELQEISVCEITHADVIDSLGAPLYGGLHDPRMGPLDRFSKCTTCGFQSSRCPGHLGTIKLSHPVYQPLLISDLRKLLHATCVACKKFKMQPSRKFLYMKKFELLNAGLVDKALDILDAPIKFLNFEDEDACFDEEDKRLDNSEYVKLGVKDMEIIDKKVKKLIEKKAQDSGYQTVEQYLRAYKFSIDRHSHIEKHRAVRNFLSECGGPSCAECGCPAAKFVDYQKKYLYINVIPAIRAKIVGSHQVKDFSSLLQNLDEDRVDRGQQEEGEQQNQEAMEVDEVTENEEGEKAPTEQQKAKQKRKTQSVSKKVYDVYPKEVLTFLESVWTKEEKMCYNLYGTAESEDPKPSMFFMSIMPVMATKFRPPRVIRNETFLHPFTTMFKQILISNQTLDEWHQKKQAQESLSLTSVLSALQESVNLLFLNSEDEKQTSIRKTLDRKEGLFRKNIMGKRVNYAGRSVILPDPYIASDEVVIPKSFAMSVTVPVSVTSHNIDQLRKFVMRGGDVYPGANYIEGPDGTLFALKRQSEGNLQAASNSLLRLNGKVHRHILDGDVVIMNRQPSLHRPSMMGHKVRVSNTHYNVIRLNYINCKSYNADFDGDEMNAHFPQNDLARSECYNIAIASKQYISPTSGEPLRGLIQDHIVAAVLLTQKDSYLTEEEFQNFVFGAVSGTSNEVINMIPPCILKPQKLWSGKQVITMLLNTLLQRKESLNLDCKTKIKPTFWGIHTEEGMVIIRDNELLTGVLDKNQIGASEYGLVHAMYECYGSESSRDILTCITRLCTLYLQYHGFTCGLDDCMLTEDADNKRAQLFKKADEECRKASVEYVQGQTSGAKQLKELFSKTLKDDRSFRMLDQKVKKALNVYTTEAIQTSIPKGQYKAFPKNFLTLMTESGAKGSMVNASQMSCCLGLQEFEGKRIRPMISGKTLPCFDVYDTSAVAGGYVASRFLTGMNPKEYFFHTMAGREGLIDTAVKTARSGYLQRSLIKHLESLVIHYDDTVRASNTVVQFQYGGDGVDTMRTSFMEQLKFIAQNQRPLAQKYNVAEMADKYRIEGYCHPEAKKYMKKVFKKGLNNVNNPLDPITYVLDPRTTVGSTSESFAQRIEEFIKTNPEGLIMNEDDEATTNPLSITENRFRAISYLKFLHSRIDPGEAVGILAGQGIGEPSTQMTLNTFHFAGLDMAHVTVGIPRLVELLMTGTCRTTLMTLPVKKTVGEKEAQEYTDSITKLTFKDVLESMNISEKYVIERETVYSVSDLLLKFNVQDLASTYAFPVKKLFRSAILGSFLLPLCTLIKKGKGKSGSTTSKNLASILQDQIIKVKNNPNADADDEFERVENLAAEDEEEVEKKAASKKKKSKKINFEADGEEEEKEKDDDKDDEEDKSSRQKEYEDEEKEEKAEEEEEEEEGDDEEEKKKKKKKKQSKQASSVEDMLLQFHFLSAYTVDVNTGYVTIKFKRLASEKKLFYYSLVEQVAQENKLAYVEGIDRATLVMPKQGQYEISIDGINFEELIAIPRTHEVLNVNDITTNNITLLIQQYGIEAGRQMLVNEIGNVFKSYGIKVDERHIALIADYQTMTGTYQACNRHALQGNITPFHKAAYETATSFVKEASTFGQVDNIESPSSRLVFGRLAGLGTGSFELFSPVQQMI